MIAGEPDRFGVSARLFGRVDDDFFGALGRIAALAALLESRFGTLAMTTDGCSEFEIASESRKEQGRRLKGALIARRRRGQSVPSEIDDLSARIETTLKRRHEIIHSLWTNPTFEEARGWRVGRDSVSESASTVWTHTTTEDLRSLIVTLSELVTQVGDAISTVGAHPSVDRSDHDLVRAEWRSDIKRIEPHVDHLVIHRTIWSEMNHAIERAGGGDEFLDHYHRLYGDSMSVGVRRLTKSGYNDRQSLGRLLKRIDQNYEVVAAYRPDWTRERVAADRTRLRSAGSRIEGFVDNLVAHVGDTDPGLGATVGELNSAIDTIVGVFSDYFELISGEYYFPIKPRRQGWEVPFRKPLF